MEFQNLDQEQKLYIILCGPLPRTEDALLQRGDVEIIREDDNLNLLIGVANKRIDCDMMIVEAPYGHGLYGMTYRIRNHNICPVWMVADPPDKIVWREINRQLDEVPAKRQAAHNKAICEGPPRHEILILTDTPERRDELTGWIREIYTVWKIEQPPLNVPENAKCENPCRKRHP